MKKEYTAPDAEIVSFKLREDLLTEPGLDPSTGDITDDPIEP